jgi:hypothetical protein
VKRRIAKSALQPTRKSFTALSLSIAALFAVPTAQAFELKLEDGWKGSLDTTVSLGTSWRMQSADPKLYSAGNSSAGPTPFNPNFVAGIPVGSGGTNTDSGNLNWDKGDQFSTLLKVTSDLSLSKGQMGAFARVKAWYDYALEDQSVRRGHHGTNWTQNAKLSDSGYDRLQKFSGVALLDAYVYNTFDVAGKPLQLRLGNQVINWGESLFIQGVNVVNPIDLSALRKPGAEVKEAFLPITALSANLGLGGGSSLEAFYQFRWTPSNIDSCGAYFGVVETQLTTKAGQPCSVALTTTTSSFSNFTNFNNPGLAGLAGAAGAGVSWIPMADGREGDDSQFGVAFRFPVEKLDTEFGVYAARISSRTPVVSGITGSRVNAALGPLAAAYLNNHPSVTVLSGGASGTTYGRGFWEYPNDIDVYALSASTNIAGWSIGAELSHTPNLPVQINANDLLQGLLFGHNAGGPGKVGGPMGQIAFDATPVGHAGGTEVSGFRELRKTQFQINGVKLFPGLLGSAQGAVVGEVAYQNANVGNSYTGLRYGRAFIFGYGKHSTTNGTCQQTLLNPASVNPQVDGCENDGYATQNSWGYRLRLGLEYPNFMNTGMTLFPTFSFSHDVDGYSVDNQFIEDRKVYGASFRFNIQRVHNIELSYIQYGDSAKYDPFRDRDFMSLVFSTTF